MKADIKTRPDVLAKQLHIVEIASDSGESTQKAGQAFGAICAKMGNGVWTVAIIPAEMKPQHVLRLAQATNASSWFYGRAQHGR